MHFMSSISRSCNFFGLAFPVILRPAIRSVIFAFCILRVLLFQRPETISISVNDAVHVIAINFAASPSEISVDSVWPFYGPVAGGTRVTITGQYLSNVTDVYFGQHQGFIDKHRYAFGLGLLMFCA